MRHIVGLGETYTGRPRVILSLLPEAAPRLFEEYMSAHPYLSDNFLRLAHQAFSSFAIKRRK